MDETSDEISVQLSKQFDDAFDINEQLKESSLSTNSRQFQNKVSEGIKLLEESTKIVNELSLFSSNESVEEISTKNMKYLLLPALLADLTLKSLNNERLEILKIAEIYFNDFIQRLNDYQICDIDMKRPEDTKESQSKSLAMSASSLESAARLRNDKINRYKAGQEMDNKLKQFREQMSQTKGPIDDEILRDYYMTLLKRWVNTALEELNSIESEKPIVEHMSQMKGFTNNSKREPKTKTPLKPFIITRNEVQKKVYGLGYPSIPTVSINDFVDQKIKEGTLSITNPIYNNTLLEWAENPDKKLREDEQEEERIENLVEKDDFQNLMRLREKDDWRDEHKRGEGNRKNKG